MSKRKKSEAIIPAVADATQPVQAMVSSLDRIAETVRSLKRIRKFIVNALKAGVDYDEIPGTKKKTLYQPGAEKFCLWLRLKPKYDTISTEFGEGHVEVVSRCHLLSGVEEKEVFQGPICSCSTMESNYRYRWEKREPGPAKEEAQQLKAVGRGKWRKEKIFENKKLVGEQWIWYDRCDNPNIYDTRNVVRQMAEKRALVKVVRNMGALSEIFTEPVEEWDVDEESSEQSKEPKPSGHIVSMGAEPRRADKDSGAVALSSQVESARAKAQSSPRMPAAPEQMPILIVEWQQDNSLAALTGNDALAALVNLPEWHPKEVLGPVWTEKRWIAPATFIPTVGELCQKHGIAIQEIGGRVMPGVKASSSNERRGEHDETALPHQGSASPATPRAPISLRGADNATIGASSDPSPQRPETAAESVLGNASAAASTVVKSTKTGLTGAKKIPYLDVLWGRVWHRCFDQKLFGYLNAAQGKDAELILEGKFQNVIGIRRIGNRQFDETGVPIIQMREDRTGPLFQE